MRIDDRLLHGQVLAGWVQPLGIRHVVIANDAVAEDKLQVELYRAVVPVGLKLDVLPLNKAGELRTGGEETMILVSSPADARRLVEAGVTPDVVNIGGLHQSPGRTEIFPFVWVSADDKRDIRFLLDAGLKIEIRMLPDDPLQSLARVVEGSC